MDMSLPATAEASGAIGPGPHDARPRGVAVDVLLVAAVLVLTGPVVQLHLAQQQSRYALTAALWDHGTVVLDEYEHVLSVDRAEVRGRTYSDKAPGQPFLAVPFYALYRAVGGEPATVLRQRGNLGVWWVSLWLAAVPAAVLAVLMRRWAGRLPGARERPEAAVLAALALALGSLLLPFATQLFGHVLAGMFALAAGLLVTRRQASPWALLAGGLLTGLAVVTEFQVALLAVVLTLAAAVRHRWAAAWVVAGGILPALGLLAYNTVVFGGPLVLSYQHSASFGAAHAQGFVGARLPSPAMLVRVLVGSRGLFTLTPVVAVAAWGLVDLVRRRLRLFEAWTGLAAFGALVAMQSGWPNPLGGSSPGPRYVVPALPFLALGAAHAFVRWPRVTAALAGLSVLTMGVATYTLPLTSPRETFALGHWIWLLGQGRVAQTVFTLVAGRWTLVLQIVVGVALAGLAVALARRQGRASFSRRGASPAPGS